jgi:hypothetical protein
MPTCDRLFSTMMLQGVSRSLQHRFSGMGFIFFAARYPGYLALRHTRGNCLQAGPTQT